jgi:hypothetical protein
MKAIYFTQEHKYAIRGIDVQDFKPGDVIDVPDEDAEMLIAIGAAVEANGKAKLQDRAAPAPEEKAIESAPENKAAEPVAEKKPATKGKKGKK